MNDKKMDTGRFLFNRTKQSSDEVFSELTKKLDEYFRWYASFNNAEPIHKLLIFSSDFSCSNECKIPMNSAISALGNLIDKAKATALVKELADKHKLEIDSSLELE